MLEEFASVGLLERVWPTDRVTMGMGVSKWMRRDLTQQLDTVTLKVRSLLGFATVRCLALTWVVPTRRASGKRLQSRILPLASLAFKATVSRSE